MDCFSEFLPMNDRDTPLKDPCKKCGMNSICRVFSGTISIASDSTMNPNKATGGQWNRLMDKMKKGTPKRLHDNLDRATARTGRRWMG